MGTSAEQIIQMAQQDPLAKQWQEKGYFSREQPQHTVILAEFLISKFPITVGEFQVFIRSGGYHQAAYWTAAGWAWRQTAGQVQPLYWEEAVWAGNALLPVVGVSWFEAYAYCRWFSELVGQSYRLPTEAEWEKAARGTDGRLYPWGNNFAVARCNTRTSGEARTLPIEKLCPQGDSPYGCAEMVGNVSEWTSSQFRPYPYCGQDGRERVTGSALRVTRGGSWSQPQLRARTAARGMNDPYFADNDVGFRCVRELGN